MKFELSFVRSSTLLKMLTAMYKQKYIIGEENVYLKMRSFFIKKYHLAIRTKV